MRCTGCGADMGAPEVDIIVQVDEQWRALHANYERLTQEWTALASRREELIESLRLTQRSPEDLAAAAEAAQRAASAEAAAQAPAPEPHQPAAVDPFAVAPRAAAEPVASAVATQQASAFPPPQPRSVTPPLPRKPRVHLSAPALLGVTGASLLIAAAIIFVAVTWNTFVPVLQGLILLAVGAAVGYLARWLSRHDLTVTAGAVGTVSMAMAGAAVMAAHRGELNFGSFALALAMLATTGAGVALSRLGVRWVGSASAVTSLGSAVGATYAVANIVDIDNGMVWALAGTLFSAALAGTLALWPTATSRWIVKIGAVAWTGATALAGASYLGATGNMEPAWVAASLGPVVALAAASWKWPRVALGPLAGVTSALAATGAFALTDSGWASMTAVAAVVLAAVVTVGRCPAHWRTPLLVGATPAFVAGVGAAIVLAFMVAVRLLSGGWGPSFDLWQPWPLLLLGLAGAAMVTWRISRGVVAAGVGFGAVAMVSGVALAALATIDRFFDGGPVETAVALTCAAVAVVATSWLWPTSAPQLIVRVGGTLLGVAAHVFAVSTLVAMTEVPMARPLAVAIAVPVLLATAGWWWPRLMVPVATLTAVGVPAAVWMRFDGFDWNIAAALGATATVLAGALALAPRSWRAPGVLGLVPAVTVSAFSVVQAVISALSAVAVSVFGSSPVDTSWVDQWWAAAAAATGFTFIAILRWTLRHTNTVRVIEWLGAVAATAAASLAAADVAAEIDLGLMGVAIATIYAAVAVTLTLFAWESRNGRWASGIGGAALMTIAGIYGAAAFSGPFSEYWPGGFVALAPILLLATLAARFPRVVWAPVALLTTNLSAAIVAHHGGSGFAQAAGATAALALFAWAGVRVPDRWRWPLLIGMAPAALVASGISVWTATVAIARMAATISGGDSAEANVWAAATAGLSGLALAGIQHWKMPRVIGSIASFAGTAAVLGAAGTVMYGFADRLGGVDGNAAIAGAGALAALAALAFVVLWESRSARQVNGYGAAVLMTVAGLHGAAAYSQPGIGEWPGLVVLVGPVVALAAFAWWWPRATVAPAVFLVGVACYSVGLHLAWPPHASAALAAAGVAVVSWLPPVLPARLRVPLVVGLAPAAVAGLGYSLAVPLFTMPGWTGWGGADDGAVYPWMPIVPAIVVLAAFAARYWPLPAPVRVVAESLGAVAAVMASVALLLFADDRSAGHRTIVASVVLAAAAASAATAWWWRTRAVRWTVGVVATSQVTLMGLASALWASDSVDPDSMAWPAGLAVIAAMVACLAVVGVWFPGLTLGPATLLATAGVAGVAVGAGADNGTVAAALAATVAVGAWIAAAQGARHRIPILAGVAPAALSLAGVFLWRLADAAIAAGGVASRLGDEQPASGDAWYALAALMLFAALLSFVALRKAVWWIALPFMFVVVAALPVEVAWLLPVAAGVAAAGVGPRWRASAGAAAAHAAVGVVWAAGADWSLSIALLAWSIGALWVARRDERSRRWAIVIVQLAGAAGVAFALLGTSVSALAVWSVGLGALAVIGVALTVTRFDETGTASRLALGFGGPGAALAAGSLAGGGVVLIVAGVAWIAHLALGWSAGRWLAAAFLTAGTASLLWSNSVAVAEAYTAVPAVSLLAIGVWWLRDNPAVNTTRALGPGLLMALAPSWVLAIAQPNEAVRILSLTLAVLVLAVVGTRLRWFAPVLAAALTAVVIAVSQFFATDAFIAKWVSIAIVGGLLIAMAAAYERLRQLK